MTTQKILQINPELFKFNSRKNSSKKKEKKTKPIHDKTQSLQSNKLKKELLKKVKDYQKNKETEVINDEKNKEKMDNISRSNLFESKDFENNDFEREFNKSLTFLHDLSKKNKDKNKKKTLKLTNADINIEIPKDSLIYNSAKEPNYGCLKNGSKPTFRDLNKTQKHVSHSTHTENAGKRLQLALENNTYYDHSAFHDKYQTNDNITIQTDKPNIELKISEELPVELPAETPVELPAETPVELPIKISNSNTNLSTNKLFIKENNEISNDIVSAPYDYTNNYSTKPTNKDEEVMSEETKEDTYIPKLQRITRTYKYKLGKKKDTKHIGLLIKNRDTQKKIKQEVSQLKQQPIQDVKNFLREKNLIKLGSQAPNDVLRKLYEDSMLSGEITNTNSNNLVHNYLNTM